MVALVFGAGFGLGALGVTLAGADARAAGRAGAAAGAGGVAFAVFPDAGFPAAGVIGVRAARGEGLGAGAGTDVAGGVAFALEPGRFFSDMERRTLCGPDGGPLKNLAIPKWSRT